MDTLFSVGLKAPGARRGFYRGRRLVDDVTLRGAQQAIGSQRGVRIVWTDSLLPHIRIKVADQETMARVRRLPFVDYFEPALVPREGLLDSWDGCENPAGVSPGFIGPSGDMISESFRMSRVDRAWPYSTGLGEAVAVVDAGVQPHPDFDVNFTAGASWGRSLVRLNTGVNSYYYKDCTHGTRLASVIGSPMNGEGVVGAAYQSSIVSVYFSDTPVELTGADAFQGIRVASNSGARVVAMAWSVARNHDAIADEIDRLYFRAPPHDVLFVGAGGTSPASLPKGNIVFPADQWNVLAVSAADFSGYRDNQSHYGFQLDLVAYQPVNTVGSAGGGLSSISNSSAATGVIAGVAALVRARYPSWTNAAVMQRMLSTAGENCGRPTPFGPIVNAEAAVGGLCVRAGQIWGPSEVVYDGTSEYSSLDIGFAVTVSGGVGPIEIVWSNGTVGAEGIYTLPRGTYPYGISVSIRDTGVSGPPMILNRVVQVIDQCDDPSVPRHISLCPAR